MQIEQNNYKNFARLKIRGKEIINIILIHLNSNINISKFNHCDQI